MSGFTALIDEHHDPPLRATLGRLLTHAASADFAISRMRLAALDLTSTEAAGVGRCRVMLGHLDADVLLEATGEATVARERIRLLTAFAQSGRLEIRTAPHHVWAPDFSIFRGLPGNRSAALVGAHYFGIPYPRFGLALTCVLTKEAQVQRCVKRFDQLWAAGYDVLPVIIDTLLQLAS